MFTTVTMMRTQRMRMVPSSKHYHDIFKCLRDEILEGGKRRISTKETIKEYDDGGYRAYTSEDYVGYIDIDLEKQEMAPPTHPSFQRRRPIVTPTIQTQEEREKESDDYYHQETTNYASEEYGYGYDGYD